MRAATREAPAQQEPHRLASLYAGVFVGPSIRATFVTIVKWSVFEWLELSTEQGERFLLSYIRPCYIIDIGTALPLYNGPMGPLIFDSNEVVLY